jgi:hypothetical protein
VSGAGASPTGYPRAPRTLRAGLVAVDAVAQTVTSVVVFQYNPDSLSRTLQPRAVAEGGDRLEALRLTGPPNETLHFDAELDAADQLEHADLQANQPVAENGLLPVLWLLERMITPTALELRTTNRLYDAGSFEITPTEADLTLLVWGSRRVLPVRVSGLTIVEEAFDPALRPIRAKVTIECKALSTSDLPQAHLGTALYLAYREAAERFAASVTTTMVRPLGVARLP